MALTSSNLFPIGTKAPDFCLYDTISGKTLSLNNLKGEKGTVIMFICNHCPFVLHVNKELVKLANDYASKGIKCIAISSNDVENYPQDSPELMKVQALKLAYPFPYLYDESQSVAKDYDAACTPDFYIFNDRLEAVYHGQLDDSRPGLKTEVTGKDIRAAIDQILHNKQIIKKQFVSVGCGIKWK